MITTDPIADMLTRIRNANLAGKTEVKLPYSNLKARIADILVKNGYIVSATTSDKGPFKALVLDIDQTKAKKTITTIERVSKPGRRIYAKRDEIPRVLGGRGIVIVSTPAGIMTGYEARAKGVGGELICKVW
ncbi:30S ribosomal protein S8 [Candidatus Saccharibacteria bacterium]|nr:30S ribosomal protein S8 [Candidatus Saccharibacteria bacterium]